jgi:hypothetical protein
MWETQNVTMAILAKQLAERDELLQRRKKAKKRERVLLEER